MELNGIHPEKSPWVIGFSEGNAEMRALLGNKGANLAEMTAVLGPERVPGGFTITTAACVRYQDGGRRMPEGLEDQIRGALKTLEDESGKRLGDPEDPMLVSVRSGAPVSMPGMLDTVLNLGLNDRSAEALARQTGDPHLAWDSRRRLIQMFAEVVRGVPAMDFEDVLVQARQLHGVQADSELSELALRELVARYLEIFEKQTGESFPDDPFSQLIQSVRAVFDSWENDRAITYRRLNAIPDALGTAVTIQRMVFGNRGERSGSGVAFTRDPTTADPSPTGDFLPDAQGEDVVAGIRNTGDLEDLRRAMPDMHAELIESLARLEAHYHDIQDVEFTIEVDRLYILQTRGAKRHARAAVRFATDAVREGLLSRDEALRTIQPETLTALLHPAFAPDASFTELTRGVPASPGAAVGVIALSARAALERAAEGEDSILVRSFTSADDVAGFHAARGVLTAQGGKSSHAAIVARGMGRPCVVGASALKVDPDQKTVTIDGHLMHEGDRIAIDGNTGVVTADEVELIRPGIDKAFHEVLGWADEIRTLGVRANADTAEDARHALEMGAEGIGLCRTEHMFFGADREEIVREMFIAGELARRERLHSDGIEGPLGIEFSEGLSRLGEVQREDFRELLEVMDGLPVTIRLLDPPLHEFIPVAGFERELSEARESGDVAAAERAEVHLAVARDLEEVNPMLGTRGARLGILLEGLYEMQVKAIVEAAVQVSREGNKPPRVEIMLPLIAFESEIKLLRAVVERTVTRVLEEAGASLEVPVGTMIELPRACLIADRIAEQADFFSFGTNDLTQTTVGLSRDDAERAFLPEYLARGLVPSSPFETIDIDGVGALVKTAAEKARSVKPELTLGVCGEHGGDPASVEFFHAAGLDYVSCSPFRIPVARVAAARAALD